MKGIVKSIHKKNTMFKAQIRSPNDTSLYNRFKKYRNRLNSIIRLSRKRYYAQKLQGASGNVKQTWEVLNDILGKKNRIYISQRRKLCK